MCGIIGAYCKHTEENKEKITRLFYYSRIRGRHASGFTYHVSPLHLRTITKPIPIDSLITDLNEHWNSMKNDDGWLRLIAHARYSTSDIRYNQPIQAGNMSIVHNGIISQEDPNSWPKKYGVYCETKNDSEILLRMSMDYGLKEAVHRLKDASVAAILMLSSGEMTVARNGRRPLWKAEDYDGVYYASTKDILIRSGFHSNQINKLLPLHSEELQYRSING